MFIVISCIKAFYSSNALENNNLVFCVLLEEIYFYRRFAT